MINALDSALAGSSRTAQHRGMSMISDTTSSILEIIFKTSFLCMGRYQEDPPGEGWILEKFPFCEQLFKLRDSVLMTEDDNRFPCPHLTVA